MGGATDGSFLDGGGGADLKIENLADQDIMDIRSATPERVGRLVQDA